MLSCPRKQLQTTLAYGLVLVCEVALHAQPSVLTWHNDNARTGQNLQETTLTPANVKSSMFGKLFVMSVDGKVDAQPLYVPSVTIPGQGVHNVLYVVTEHDSAYAFDADNGTQLWKVSLLGSGESPSDDHGCGQVTPEIGLTATPAIDLQIGPHGTMYAVATSKDGSGNYHHRVHALDLTTGADQFGGPTEVQATYPGSINSETTFDPTVHKERPGLLISNGILYTSWGSHCDGGTYAGWVIGYNETTLQRVSVLNLAPNGSDNGIWAAGAGPAADANGNLYLETGNGTFDTTLTAGGFPNKGDYGNAIVKISTSGGTLAVADYFTMSNTVSESGADEDLGSGGAMLLPPLNDAQGHAHSLAVGAGKDGHIYVVDQANLGKFNSGTNAIYQDMGSILGSVFSSPAWFNGNLYYGAVSGTLQAFAFANGVFQTTPASHSSHSFGYPGTTPSISANGTTNGIVWAAENNNPAVLHAYDATNLATELYNSNQAAAGRDHFGAGNKFIVPTVVNGKVYVGTTNGVGAFGLLCSFAIAPQSITVPAAGATQMVNVVATNGCLWNASSNASFLSITSGTSGSGSGSVTYQVAANSGPTRSGTLTIAGQTFTVTETGTSSPTLNLSHTSLNFGYNAALVTSPQTITVTLAGGSSVAWTASSSQPNITASPGSGSGSGTFQITAAAGASGTVTVTAAGASNSPQQIQVNVASAMAGPPFGSFDTPVNNTSGIAGAIPVTGWALDNVEATNVGIWRDPIGGETAAANGLVFIGDAIFVPGARPDVETAYPNAPLNYRGGWGYMLLTNFLPNNGGSPGPGNGTYNLHAIAVDAAGNTQDLGTRTITVDNAHAAKPFGTIDTPSQGGSVSGNAFVNFGWALTQNPNAIAKDGSTLTVIVDGVTLGHPVYNQFRSDIATAFPGLANSNGAVGFFYIDTTTLANGMHTISWVAYDNVGHGDGVGSRYFNVLNSGAIAAPAEALAQQAAHTPASRRVTARSAEIEELDRMELEVGANSGYLIVNGERRPLPIGSTLKDGVFYWQPGPGFLGEYQLLFERPQGPPVRVKVNIQPRGAAAPVQ